MAADKTAMRYRPIRFAQAAPGYQIAYDICAFTRAYACLLAPEPEWRERLHKIFKRFGREAAQAFLDRKILPSLEKQRS